MTTSTGREPRVQPVDSVRRVIAEQIAPVVRLHGELIREWAITIDAPRVRERILGGVAGMDPFQLVSSVRTFSPAYARACAALEAAGIASEDEEQAARRKAPAARQLIEAWLRADRLPRGPVERLARMAASLVGSTLLERAAREIAEFVSFDDWLFGHCPCCGGHPDFALSGRAGRTLMCVRCNTRWSTDAFGCIGCGEVRAPVLARIHSPIGYRLAMCNGCGRYLKERDGDAAIHPLIERALTAQLDAAAEARGLRL